MLSGTTKANKPLILDPEQSGSSALSLLSLVSDVRSLTGSGHHQTVAILCKGVEC